MVGRGQEEGWLEWRMFEWENIEEGEEGEWLGEVKRRDGWSGECLNGRT